MEKMTKVTALGGNDHELSKGTVEVPDEMIGNIKGILLKDIFSEGDPPPEYSEVMGIREKLVNGSRKRNSILLNNLYHHRTSDGSIPFRNVLTGAFKQAMDDMGYRHCKTHSTYVRKEDFDDFCNARKYKK